MALHFILDGYNIIKQTSVLADKSLEEGRKSLIKLIESERPQGSLKNKVTVVFDGQPDVFGSEDSSFVKIIFSKGCSADDEIKRLVADRKNIKNIIVVTNDRAIQYYIRALGAKACKVEEFLLGINIFKEGSKNQDVKDKKIKKNLEKGVESKINAEFEKIWLDK